MISYESKQLGTVTTNTRTGQQRATEEKLPWLFIRVRQVPCESVNIRFND